MKYFNKYQLNANFTTEDGIDLINPTFEIVEIYIFAETLTFDVVLHWIDENNNIKRSLENPKFVSPNFPTVEFVEGQLLQIPAFSASTIINT